MASILDEKRGALKTLFSFYSSPTVPTIRIINKQGMVAFELGKRARVRDNSLKDTIDRKGWDIQSTPVPMIHGKNMELGYITHPAGCTVNIKPEIKIIASDEFGNPVKEGDGFKYIEASFEGVIGTQSDLDDFNESTERDQSRGWAVPFVIGVFSTLLFIGPIYAWLMSFAAGA